MTGEVTKVDFLNRRIIEVVKPEPSVASRITRGIGIFILKRIINPVIEPMIYPEEFKSRLRVSEAGHSGDFSSLMSFAERRRARELYNPSKGAI